MHIPEQPEQRTEIKLTKMAHGYVVEGAVNGLAALTAVEKVVSGFEEIIVQPFEHGLWTCRVIYPKDSGE